MLCFISLTGIDLTAFAEATSNLLPAEKVIYPTFNPKFTVISSVAVMITALIAAVYPAFKASKLKPVDALRHT